MWAFSDPYFLVFGQNWRFLALLVLKCKTKSRFPSLFLRYIFDFLGDIQLAIKFQFSSKCLTHGLCLDKVRHFRSCSYPLRMEAFLPYILKGFFLDETYNHVNCEAMDKCSLTCIKCILKNSVSQKVVYFLTLSNVFSVCK